MPHIIAIGEALVEIMRPAAGQPLDREGEFRGPFASGAPAIFAGAAARLGQRVGFIGGVGRDAFGRLLQARLAAEGIDTRAMQVISDKTTGIAFVAYAEDGSREFVFHLRDSAAASMDASCLDAAYFSGVRWLHLSGSTLFLSEASRDACWRALALAREAGGRISVDPNLRPELMPIPEAARVLAPFIEAADLLLPTWEEAQALTGARDRDEAAARLAGGRGCVVAIKQGAAGCTLYAAGQRIKGPAFAMAEVDPTGAGDCFNAACVVGLEAGWPLVRVAQFASAAGALAVTKLGPMEGAPTMEEVLSLVARS